MLDGKIIVDMKFALIKDIEYQSNSFQCKVTFFNVDKSMYVLPSTVANIKRSDVYVEYSNGAWEILPKDVFNARFVPIKKE